MAEIYENIHNWVYRVFKINSVKESSNLLAYLLEMGYIDEYREGKEFTIEQPIKSFGNWLFVVESGFSNSLGRIMEILEDSGVKSNSKKYRFLIWLDTSLFTIRNFSCLLFLLLSISLFL
jgi:hypothetical protein